MLDLGSFGSSLIGINLLAYFTIILRPRIYKTDLYRPMIKNIRLSVIPILILSATVFLWLLFGQWYESTGSVIYLAASAGFTVAGFAAWLLMLPNSGYLITELNFNHRETDKSEVPLWYDIVSVLSLALSGIFNMCFNVLVLQFWIIAVASSIYRANMMGLWADITAYALIMLCCVGIYLGRYLRLNSWDIRHPLQFFKRLASHFKTRGTFKNFLLFVTFHTLFFILFYQAVMRNIARLIFQNLWNG